MILTHIKADNVLKYKELDLTLPESGLIAISGPNESGKSTIGETVCFALFGRTFSVLPDEIDKVVRWGENHCSVTLEFIIEGTEYVLSRYLDCDGNHSAKLALKGKEEDPIARGVNPVSDKIAEILGYEYDEYVESFYLAQREITTPHPHSHAVKVMAGIEPLETALEEFKAEIHERKETLKDLKTEIDLTERDILELGIKEGHLIELEESCHESDQQVDLVSGLVEEVRTGTTTYVNNTQEIYALQSKAGRQGFFRFIFFVLAVALGGAWGLMTQAPELEQTKMLIGMLDQNLPQWQDYPQIYIAYAAAGFGVLFLYMWMRVGSVKGKIKGLREEAGKLAEILQRARDIEIEDETPEDAEQAADAEDEDAEDDDVEPMPERPTMAAFERLKNEIEIGEATARQTQEYTEPELQWLEAVLVGMKEQLAICRDEIADEQSRIQESINLHEVIDGFNERRDAINGRIEMRDKALELLGGAIESTSNHFNRDVKNLVGRMLPLFTDGRYEHLQLDQDLNVRVFSNDKRDFMDLEEVSSGTQRQIMLALRLALSQKLLSRIVKGKQFTFLDEPFAFFDEERTRNALKALTELGDDISQVWIVAQEFPEDEDVNFDIVVKCDRNSASLSVK